MKIYEYKDIEECAVLSGRANNIDDLYQWFTKLMPECEEEIHPMEIERKKRLAERSAERLVYQIGRPNDPYEVKPKKLIDDYMTISNELIVVCGGICLGTKGDEKHTIEVLTKINGLLELNGSYLVFVRSCDDDPSLFNDKRIEMSRLRTVEDYSILKTEYYSVLCLGGSVSLDKKWKIKMGEFLNKKMYWEDEGFKYNETIVDQIIREHKISFVVSHTCPTFTWPGMNSTSSMIINDKNGEVFNSISLERKNMDEIYNKMINLNNRPYMWVYTKFNGFDRDIINDISFQRITTGGFIAFSDFLDEFDLSYQDIKDGKTIAFDNNGSGRKKRRRKIQSPIFSGLGLDNVEIGIN